MNKRIIFISPSSNGYEFSIHDRLEINARLLSLLEPSPAELRYEGDITPIIRADWMSKNWLTPRKTVLLIVGIRASIKDLPSHRGSNSIWAAATAIDFKLSPKPINLKESLSDLANDFISALDAKIDSKFPNATHEILINLIPKQELSSVVLRIQGDIKTEKIPGPFFSKKS